MRKRHRILLLAAFGLCCHLRGAILGDALFSFPARTEYLEDDNLAALRRLPYYANLRKTFSGESLEETQVVLHQLGIPENEVEEIVTGSDSRQTFGLATGTFSRKDPVVKSRLSRYAVKLTADSQMYCAGRATCVMFLEDSLLAFGTPDSLKAILLARQGVLTRFSTNAEQVHLLESGDRSAPVRGILFGSQLQSALSSTLEQWFGKGTRSIRLPATITGVGYNVTFGGAVHLHAALQCTSATSAAVLAQALNALASLQSIAGPAASSDGFAFKRAKAGSAGTVVQLEADAESPDTNRRDPH